MSPPPCQYQRTESLHIAVRARAVCVCVGLCLTPSTVATESVVVRPRKLGMVAAASCREAVHNKETE